MGRLSADVKKGLLDADKSTSALPADVEKLVSDIFGTKGKSEVSFNMYKVSISNTKPLTAGALKKLSSNEAFSGLSAAGTDTYNVWFYKS